MLIEKYLGQYLLSRSVCEKHRKALRSTVDRFNRFVTQTEGRASTLDDFNDDTVNAYLSVYGNGTRRPWTVRGERSRLLTIWRDAYNFRRVSLPPLNVRRMIVPRGVVDGWDEKDAALLLAAADRLTGNFKNRWKVSRRAFARALVLTGWYSSARLGDIENFEERDIAADGSIFWIQNKTGKPQAAVLESDAIEAIKSIVHPQRKKVFRVLGRRYLYRFVKKLVESAGLTGTFRFVRRGGASVVERDHPGWGHKQCGNDPTVFARHYNVNRITAEHKRRPRPPRLVVAG